MDECIELFWKAHMKIMTQPFGVGPINHSDRPLDPLLLQHTDLSCASQIDPKTRQAGLVKQIFVTSAQRWPDILTLGRCAPIRCRGHSAMMCTEANQHGFVPESFANQLADVQFTVQTHLGGACIAHGGVVRPHYGFWFAASTQMPHQVSTRLYHAPVTQIHR